MTGRSGERLIGGGSGMDGALKDNLNEQIHDRDDAHADEQGEGGVSSGVAHFARWENGVVEAAEREHQEQDGPKPVALGRRRPGREVFRSEEEKADQNKDDERHKL